MSDAGQAPALRLQRVSKSFRSAGRTIPALDAVGFSVAPARISGLIGPDGAGKTTLMRLGAGLLAPDSGRIDALGLDVVRQPLAVQACVGYMPQRFGLYEDLSVQENLDLYADLQGVPRRLRGERYRELLHMTGLGPFTTRLAGRLSGGMKQKLGLACTLVRAPRLLLLDEPTVGVDPVSRRELWAIVYRLVEHEGMSVLLSTAYLDEAERCAEVILLHQGKILGQGTPGEFRREISGRSYALSVPGVKNRVLQERLSDRPGVVDAVIEGAHVRLVMAHDKPPSAAELLPGIAIDAINLEPVAARFEDRFVDLLRQRHGSGQTVAPTVFTAAVTAADDSAAEVAIRVRDVQRRFGDFYAVDGISFDVRRGEIFGLLGANGAGKSTTFRMLCGLLPASAGSLTVGGLDLRRAAAAARGHIGYMAQKFALYSQLTVRQNLRFFAAAYGLRGRRRRERLDWALREFALTAFTDAASGELSLGYKQRLALACALMHEPGILFLDEPTSGVDPLARREFWRRINALAESGVTVLVTTHFMEEAEYCDRLAIMAAGRILTLGTPAEIKAGARTRQMPQPDMEDAFIGLIEAFEAAGRTA